MAGIKYMTLRENIVEALHWKILNQEYVPGERIIEQNLADEFNASRGPIREALRQLEQEGLVQYKRNAGCSVRQIEFKDAYEIYLLRSNYEIMAIKEYKEDFSEEELAEFKDILEKMKMISETDRRTAILLDNQFHELIVKKAGLPRVHACWKTLDYGNVLVEMVRESCKANAEFVYSMHENLFEKLLHGSVEEKCEAITRHYMANIEKYMK